MGKKSRKIVWLTRFALTTGVEEIEVLEMDGVWAKVRQVTTLNGWDLVWSGHWHETKEEAMAHAERMRKNKIAALRKQIARLKTQRILI